MANVGYARVSTLDQDLSLQLDALADRAGLQAALNYVRDGEVLVVWKLDRLWTGGGNRYRSQQFFGTAGYLSGALGQQTIRYETQNVSQSSGPWGKLGNSSSGAGEHLQSRSLLTPDEVMRLGPTRPIVLVSGEPPYLLRRVSYLTDPAYAGRFDANPFHLPHAAE